MQIVTNNDARVALGQLTTDLSATYALVPSISPLIGTSDVQSAANSLLDTINNYAQKVYGELTPTDAPLTTVEIAQMTEIQKEVIDARSTVNQTISAVDWSFGGIFSDSVTAAENYASQAVTSVSNAVGINWTYVALGLAIVAVFFFWREIKETI